MKQSLLILAGVLLFTTAEARQRPRVFRRHTAEAVLPEPRADSPAADPAPTQGARLRVERPTYNFGDVSRKGGDLVHEFVFTNDGTAPLVVTRVVTSCSCLKTSYPKRPVPPGESGVILVTYEPHKSEPGAFNKVIHIYSNSVDGRDVITVQGNSFDAPRVRKIKGDKADNRDQ